jgi:hypothetical protein
MHRRQMTRRPFPGRGDSASPPLLPTFVVGTLAMVVAIVAMARIDNGWGDAAAVVFLVIVAGVLLLAIVRRLSDGADDDEDGQA